MDESQELIEDIEDLVTVAEQRDEPTISHEELLAELREEGIIPATSDD